MSIASVRIENFRCFDKLKVQPTALVNLIGGKNNVGKTSFLEALFLALGPTNPELSLRVTRFRGLDPVTLGIPESWSWLFANRATERPIVVELVDDRGVSHALTLKLHALNSVEGTIGSTRRSAPGPALPSPSANSAEWAATHELQYEHSAPNQQPLAASARFGAGRIEIGIGNVQFPNSVFLSARHPRTGAEEVQRLRLVEEDEDKERLVIDLLRVIVPTLKRISVAVQGGEPLVRAVIEPREHIPINMFGEGLVKLTSIALAAATASHGCVLIDEIENGLHYGALREVWRGLAELARASNVQVFATTHSRECVVAAHDAFKELLEYEFAYHRLERSAEGVTAVSYGRDELDDAIEFEHEVR